MPAQEQVLFICWEACHLKNDLVFGKAMEAVNRSTIFMDSYCSFYSIYHSTALMNPQNKGKDVVAECQPYDILSRTIVAW